MQEIVVLVESGEHREATAAMVRTAAADLEVVLCTAGELSARIRETFEANGNPTAILLGPHLSDPIGVARVAYGLAPQTQMVFLVRAEQEDGLRRRLALAPRIGTNWAWTPADGSTLGRVLETAARSTRQRLQHRTTLDRVRLSLPSSPPADGSEYRRLVLADRYFSSILAHVPDAVFSTDPQGLVQSWNRGAERCLGYSASEILGRHVGVLESDKDEPLVEFFQEVTAGAPEVRRECFLRRSDGAAIAAELSLAPVRDEQGILLGISVIARDVTDRRKAQAAVHQQKERLRVTLASIGDGVITTDAEGRVDYLNAVAESLTGWSLADVVGRRLAEVFRIENEYSREPVENPVEKVLRDGVRVGLANHTILIARDGTERPIDDSAAPIRDKDGQLLGVVLIFRDVTEARSAERRLSESENRFRQLADSMPQMIWTARPDGFLDYYNERWYEFTGNPRGEGGDASWAPILHPDDVERCRDVWYESVRTGKPYEIEYRFHDRRTDCYRWFLGRALPVRSEQGEIQRWIGTCTDIDDAKRAGDTARFLAEAAGAVSELMDLESTLPRVARAAVPTFADWSAVDLLDAEGELRRVEVAHLDPAKAKLLSEISRRHPIKPDAAQGVPKGLRTGEPELVSDVSESLLKELARDQEHLRLLREAKLRSYMCVPLLSKGRTLGALTFATAESGRRYELSDLRAAQDLARHVAIAVENAWLYEALTEADQRKDEFLATLAHELRNPLAPIKMGLDVLRLGGDDPATVSEMLDTMDSQVRQMVRLIDDLLDVSRITRGKLELRTKRVELAEIIKNSMDAVRPLVDAAGHRLSVSLPDEPVTLEADPARLSQVFSNLLNNAAKYTPPNGEIVLTAELQEGELVVSIRDTGIGIPQGLVENIFEMFRQVDGTLERSTSGLGIGLTLVRRLVEMHGGTVRGRSEGEGKGSEFIVRLPLVLSTKNDSAPSSGEVDRQPDRQRVLVVDDNRDAADTLATMLRMMGQEVQIAYDGVEAIAAAASFCPDVVLMDIGMPKLNGYDAAGQIRQRSWGKNLTLVALTGWGQQQDRRRSAEAGFDRHLVKPVEMSDLREILATRL